jgi:protein TonB
VADVDNSMKLVSVDGMTAGTATYAIKYASATGKTLRISEADAERAATSKVIPTYPLVARQLRVAGRVMVEAVVNEGGSVQRVKSLNGNPLLANSAIDAVKKWKFRPFLANGKPTVVVVTLSFNFTDK